MYLPHNKPWWLAATLGYISGLPNHERPRDGIRVICYHGVTEQKKDLRLERNLQLLSSFKSQIRLLQRFRVLSLAELSDELSIPQRQSKPAAVITFDDGYVNNLIAAEILAKARLPWSVFITTGAIGREKAIWTVELSLLMLHGQAERIEVLNKVWHLRNRTEREAAFQGIRYPLKSMDMTLRQQTMDCIRQQFPKEETQRLLLKFPSLQMLSWQEVCQLRSAEVGIGSHGVSHEIHHDTQQEAVRLFELRESKAELEKHLGHSCDAFAFPNGNFSSASANEVLAAGYKLALTTQRGTLKSGANHHLIPRLWPISSLRHFSRNFFWEPASIPDEI